MDTRKVNIMEIGTKAQSKAELYRLLTVEGGMYLPPQDQTNMEFISDIAFSVKKALYSDDIRVCQVPHIDGLRAKDSIKFIVQECDGEDYLPSNYTDYIPNRVWLANICNTLSHDQFQSMMHDVLSIRENSLLEKRNLTIDINPRVASIFKNSQMVATTKGKSHHLLRKKLMRDKKQEKELIESQKNDALNTITPLQETIEDLKKELESKEKKLKEMEDGQDILSRLFEDGIIDAHGNLLK